MGLDKETINRCAQTIHEAILKTDDYSLFGSAGTMYYNEWMKIQSELYEPNYTKPEYSDIIDDVIFSCLKNYDISLGDFEHYFNKSLAGKTIFVGLNNRKYWRKHTSFDDKIGSDNTDDNNRTFEEVISDKKSLDYQERYENKELIRQKYLFAADIKLTERKKSFSYSRMIFTDMLAAYNFIEPDDCREFFEFNQTKFDNAADIDFAASFFQNDCSSVTDFPQNNFRMLSEFTGKESDRDKPCGDEVNIAKDNKRAMVVLYNDVYISYIAKKKGEVIKSPSISEQKTKYFKLLFPNQE